MEFGELSVVDDVMADTTLDALFLWFRTHKFDSNYQPLPEERARVLHIIIYYVVLERRLPEAVKLLLEMPRFKSLYSDEKGLKRLARQARRYLGMYSPTAGFEISQTLRYAAVSSKSEACVLATREFFPGYEIKDCSGSIAILTPEQDQNLGQDFSVINTSRRGTNLFLGPARFVNHDCDANCAFISSGAHTVYLKAIKFIKVGEEMTVQYANDYFGKNNRDCLCATCERLVKGGYCKSEDQESSDDDDEKKPADPTIAEILSDERTPSQNLRHRSSKVSHYFPYLLKKKAFRNAAASTQEVSPSKKSAKSRSPLEPESSSSSQNVPQTRSPSIQSTQEASSSTQSLSESRSPSVPPNLESFSSSLSLQEEPSPLAPPTPSPSPGPSFDSHSSPAQPVASSVSHGLLTPSSPEATTTPPSNTEAIKEGTIGVLTDTLSNVHLSVRKSFHPLDDASSKSVTQGDTITAPEAMDIVLNKSLPDQDASSARSEDTESTLSDPVSEDSSLSAESEVISIHQETPHVPLPPNHRMSISFLCNELTWPEQSLDNKDVIRSSMTGETDDKISIATTTTAAEPNPCPTCLELIPVSERGPTADCRRCHRHLQIYLIPWPSRDPKLVAAQYDLLDARRNPGPSASRTVEVEVKKEAPEEEELPPMGEQEHFIAGVARRRANMAALREAVVSERAREAGTLEEYVAAKEDPTQAHKANQFILANVMPPKPEQGELDLNANVQKAIEQSTVVGDVTLCPVQFTADGIWRAFPLEQGGMSLFPFIHHFGDQRLTRTVNMSRHPFHQTPYLVFVNPHNEEDSGDWWPIAVTIPRDQMDATMTPKFEVMPDGKYNPEQIMVRFIVSGDFSVEYLDNLKLLETDRGMFQVNAANHGRRFMKSEDVKRSLMFLKNRDLPPGIRWRYMNCEGKRSLVEADTAILHLEMETKVDNYRIRSIRERQIHYETVIRNHAWAARSDNTECDTYPVLACDMFSDFNNPITLTSDMASTTRNSTDSKKKASRKKTPADRDSVGDKRAAWMVQSPETGLFLNQIEAKALQTDPEPQEPVEAVVISVKKPRKKKSENPGQSSLVACDPSVSMPSDIPTKKKSRSRKQPETSGESLVVMSSAPIPSAIPLKKKARSLKQEEASNEAPLVVKESSKSITGDVPIKKQRSNNKIKSETPGLSDFVVEEAPFSMPSDVPARKKSRSRKKLETLGEAFLAAEEQPRSRASDVSIKRSLARQKAGMPATPEALEIPPEFTPIKRKSPKKRKATTACSLGPPSLLRADGTVRARSHSHSGLPLGWRTLLPGLEDMDSTVTNETTPHQTVIEASSVVSTEPVVNLDGTLKSADELPGPDVISPVENSAAEGPACTTLESGPSVPSLQVDDVSVSSDNVDSGAANTVNVFTVVEYTSNNNNFAQSSISVASVNENAGTDDTTAVALRESIDDRLSTIMRNTGFDTISTYLDIDIKRRTREMLLMVSMEKPNKYTEQLVQSMSSAVNAFKSLRENMPPVVSPPTRRRSKAADADVEAAENGSGKVNRKRKPRAADSDKPENDTNSQKNSAAVLSSVDLNVSSSPSSPADLLLSSEETPAASVKKASRKRKATTGAATVDTASTVEAVTESKTAQKMDRTNIPSSEISPFAPLKPAPRRKYGPKAVKRGTDVIASDSTPTPEPADQEHDSEHQQVEQPRKRSKLALTSAGIATPRKTTAPRNRGGRSGSIVGDSEDPNGQPDVPATAEVEAPRRKRNKSRVGATSTEAPVTSTTTEQERGSDDADSHHITVETQTPKKKRSRSRTNVAVAAPVTSEDQNSEDDGPLSKRTRRLSSESAIPYSSASTASSRSIISWRSPPGDYNVPYLSGVARKELDPAYTQPQQKCARALTERSVQPIDILHSEIRFSAMRVMATPLVEVGGDTSEETVV
ncbi:Histone-lysine N-methyltransferase set9 [Gryganskiella cystojenkinii]|nr:Histone-lysine N-methyltransferase set9 [Gryganskiella cystojenkinii]